MLVFCVLFHFKVFRLTPYLPAGSVSRCRLNCLKCMLQVWELSDIDRDGMLDRDEFAVVSPVLPHTHTHTRFRTLTAKSVQL